MSSLPKPLYTTAKQNLLGRIRSGELLPGDRVPAHKSIARSLNVSEGTVSRAITELTQEGFLVSRPRSGVVVADRRQTCSKQVALLNNLLFDPRTPDVAIVYQKLLMGLQSGIGRMGFELTSIPVRKDWDDPMLPVEQIFGRNLAAVVCMNVLDLEYLMQLKSLSVPVIVLDRDTFDIGMDCVVLDNLAASFQLTSRLIAWGHREIAFVGKILPGDQWLLQRYDPATSQRLRGYRLALDVAGIAFDPARVAFAPDDRHILEEACRDILEMGGASYSAVLTEFGGEAFGSSVRAGFAWADESAARQTLDLYAFFDIGAMAQEAVRLVDRRKGQVSGLTERVLLPGAIHTPTAKE